MHHIFEHNLDEKMSFLLQIEVQCFLLKGYRYQGNYISCSLLVKIGSIYNLKVSFCMMEHNNKDITTEVLIVTHKL
jgi:hypothetical protein